jgi:TetR/AcrR family transcriptional regulator, cholesterol catabolism regulator
MARAAARSGGSGVRGTYAPAETRKALLTAALELFDVRGYHATSVEDIVAAAGVTKGALYHHFDGKEEILLQIQEDYISDRLRNAEEILAAHESATERLRKLIHESLVAVDQYRGHVTVFLQERRFLSGERFASIKSQRDRLDAIYESVIRQGVADGEFKADLQSRIASFAILGTLAWAYNWYRPDGLLSVAEVADQLTSFVLTGIQS